MPFTSGLLFYFKGSIISSIVVYHPLVRRVAKFLSDMHLLFSNYDADPYDIIFLLLALVLRCF